MLEVTNTQQALKFAGFIEEALEYVDDWTPTDISRGGCGIFADYLCGELEKIGLQYEIYACFFDGCPEVEDIKSALRKFIRTGKIGSTDCGVQHVLVKVGDLWLDNAGIANRKALDANEKIMLTKEQLETLNADRRLWNEHYDTKCNDFIKQKLDEAFSKYADFHTGSLPMPKPEEVTVTEHTARYRARDMQERSMFPLIRMLGGR